jgi:hypothetical protein
MLASGPADAGLDAGLDLMKPPFLAVVLCAALTLAVAAEASAAAEEPPTQLWEEFPLEPGAPPSVETTPGSRSQPARPARGEEDSGGIGAGTLIWVVLVAAAIGEIVATTAARAIPSRDRGAAPAPRPLEPPPPAPVLRRQAEPAAARRLAPGAPASPDVCRISLRTRERTGRFDAVPDHGGRVLAHSPDFRLRRAPGDPDVSPPEALDLLVEQLEGAGWHRTGAGPKPWDLRFERELQAAASKRSG